MRRLILFVLVYTLAAAAQGAPDPALLAQIQKIPAIDNHTHVMKVTAPGEHDDEFDALPCDTLEAWDAAFFTRTDRPEIVDAWKVLYGYGYSDQAPDHVRELIAEREKQMRQQGDNFANWVLEKINTRVMFANRVAMGRGLAAPRFVWVPYDDALLFPLNNAGMADTPDRKFFFGREEMLLKRYLGDLKLAGMPKTLDEYVRRIVLPTLQRQKQNGAVALKFEVAYLRALDFAASEEKTAADEYRRGIESGNPLPGSEYKVLQDFLFRTIAVESGRLGLPIHIHTGSGCGRYFQLAGSNPMLMESLLNDRQLARTNFVFIHGAWPFTEQMAGMLARPNVFTDTSAQTFLVSNRRFAESIRQWLEFAPEKLLFGTDTFAGSDPQYGWDTVAWQTSHNAREALALALTGMMQDGEITRAQTLQFAHMVLHGNAEKLYGLK
jgi:predicted TIM-barrel fold metal-dependent hydrolase